MKWFLYVDLEAVISFNMFRNTDYSSNNILLVEFVVVGSKEITQDYTILLTVN